MNYNSIKEQVPLPAYTETVIKHYQSTRDIIADLIYCFKTYNHQARQVSKVSTGNIQTDGKEIYDFIQRNIKYKAEPEKNQTTRSFSRIIHDKWGDCKHSAIMVGSIAWNQGYNVIFRFVGYEPGETFGHVYTIIEDPNTKERVIVDPLQEFNFEKPRLKEKNYIAVHNSKTNNMTLSRLTGTEAEIGRKNKVERKEQRLVKKEQRIERRAEKKVVHPYPAEMTVVNLDKGQEMTFTPELDDTTMQEIDGMYGIGKRSKAERKKVHAARKEKRKARGGVVKTVALAPVRAAFTGLLMLNFHNLASRFKSAIAKNENEVKAFAKKFGYRYDKFKATVLKGSTKKSLGEISGFVKIENEGIGFVITAAAITTAAPAVVVAVSLLKRLGLGSDKTDKVSLDKAATDLESLTSGSNSSGNSGSSSNNSGGSSDPSGNSNPSNNSNPEADTAKNFLDLPTPVLVIGGAVVLAVAGKLFKIF